MSKAAKLCVFTVARLVDGNYRHTCQACGATRTIAADKLTRVCGAVKPRQLAGSGVGTELHAILARLGFTADGECDCWRHALEMNRRGVTWCLERRATIVDWLQAAAKKRRLPFSRAVASLIVGRAIHRAKRALASADVS